MEEKEFLARRFETHRAQLRSVAYRMLGSLPEAEDAVQEAWLHASRAGTDGVENLGGWLTTVLARVCLDQLRARASRHEESIEAAHATAGDGVDPEQEALIADSVGLALLAVLDRLPPAERLAFVLHDTCEMSFEDIAKVLGRNEDAARQLASRGRRRVHGEPLLDSDGVAAQRALVASFLAALRKGDLEALVRILDPDLVVDADREIVPDDAQQRSARGWAEQILRFSRGAKLGRIALVDGRPGIIVAPRGRLAIVIRFTLSGGQVHKLDVIADSARLAELELAVMDN